MTLRLVAIAAASTLAFAAQAADNPFQAFKGKMKPGLYEYHMEMDMGEMPGLPPNMRKQTHSFQHCVTPEDIERGQMARPQTRNGQPEDCQVKDFNMSGNHATYHMVCANGGPDMRAKMTFRDGGYVMDSDMTVPDRGGRGGTMHMKQHMESKYLGPCSGR